MIAKIVQGRGFRGAVNYILDKDNARLLYAEGVRLKDKESIIHSFIVQQKLNPNISKPVAHISLDFSVQDKSRLTDRFMVDVAQEYMKKMGYKDTQYIIARHHDTDHPHIHIVINRIDNRETDFRPKRKVAERKDLHGPFKKALPLYCFRERECKGALFERTR